MSRIFRKIVDFQKEDKKFALCTIVATRGSSPLHAGSKMVVMEDGGIEGTIGGGKLETAVIRQAVKVIQDQKPAIFHHDLKSQHQMCCGGQVDIFIEPVMKNNKLYMFGAGHIGQAVIRHAASLDFDIFVFDNREEIFEGWDTTGFNKMVAPYSELLPTLPFDDHTYVVIATYEHATDSEILSWCLKKKFAYLGMIGSKNKVATTRKMFLEAGLCTEKELDKADMPIGIDIHADTADEIAISIVEKIINEKNK